MTKNERLHALTVLIKVIEEKIPLTHALQAAQELSPFTKEICFGVCRHYLRLQIILNNLMEKRPKSSLVAIVIIIGLYQLLYLNKPSYAVVNETVALVDDVKNRWAKGLVNAVLRRFCREKDSLIARLQQQVDFEHGHPQWLLQRLQNDWPQQWAAIVNANNQQAPMSLRINQQKVTREEYLARLKSFGIKAKAQKFSPQGITLTTPCNVDELPGFSEGEVAVQDQAAQLAAGLLQLKPGLRVLDACCAPGGKTCHILESEPQLAEVVALDVDEKRLTYVTSNLIRLGLQASTIVGDALNPSTWWDGQLFDRILMDAPCSAIGVIRRHPDIKLLRTEKDLLQAASIQKAMLLSLWPLLKMGGLLVYATCSIMKLENEEQIAQFLTHTATCSLIDDNKAWGRKTAYGRQILPGDEDCDGFFYSVLLKVK